jgi:hypothetical protein
VTKDGSGIRELMHPDRHGNRNQSLAEALVPPGTQPLRILCSSSPACRHEDTEILEAVPRGSKHESHR